MFDHFVDLPIPVPRLAATREAIWAVDFAARTADEQIWRSVDGLTFSPYAWRAGAPSRFDSPVKNLILITGSSTGEVYMASVVGQPVAHRIAPSDRMLDIRLAYSRTKLRATMEDVERSVDDVTVYSLPVRDMLPLSDGGVVVLRNREDVRVKPGAPLSLLKGQHADRYDSAGRQVATATFPRSIHWIYAVNSREVAGVSNTGDTMTVKWEAPSPGGIISQ